MSRVTYSGMCDTTVDNLKSIYDEIFSLCFIRSYRDCYIFLFCFIEELFIRFFVIETVKNLLLLLLLHFTSRFSFYLFYSKYASGDVCKCYFHFVSYLFLNQSLFVILLILFFVA